MCVFFLFESKIFGSSITTMFDFDQKSSEAVRLSHCEEINWDELRSTLHRLGKSCAKISDEIDARGNYETLRKFLNGDIKKSFVILEKYQKWVDTHMVGSFHRGPLDDVYDIPMDQLKIAEPNNCSGYFNPSIGPDYLDCSRKTITSDKLLEEIKNKLLEESEDDSSDDGTPISEKPLSPLLTHITDLGDTFSKLDISYNRLLDDGLCLLAQTLQNHQQLRLLSVAHNEASQQGIYDFLMKIFTFTVVPYVDIRGNYGADLAGVRKVLDALDSDQKKVFETKIIWHGTKPFKWE